MQNLKDKINLVLSEEKRAYVANGRRGGGLGSFNIKIGGGWTTVGQVPKLILDNPNLSNINSQNSDILFRLFSSLSIKDKETFFEILLSYISKDSDYFNVSYLIFFVLHRLGKTLEALKQAQANLKGDADFGYSNMLGIFSKIIQNEHRFIAEKVLEETKAIIQNESEPSFQLVEIINSAELAKLSISLETSNSEINEDKEILKTTFEKYNFPKDLSETLDKIDEKLTTAKDNFDYKGCMDLIRSFTERFYKTVSMEIDSESGSKMNEKDSEKVAKFFIEKKLISEEQGKILTSLRHFLSNLASHRLKARAEDARLSRNMAIEFCLYLAKRYEDVYKETN